MLIDRVLRKVRKAAHYRSARAVLDTPPIVAGDGPGGGVVIFSMIGTQVLLPYLVAVKSLHARLGMGRVVILDDGSLTDADRRVLDHHCGTPQVLHIADVDTGECPRGGTWERLLTLLDLRVQDYVIQLDSDTVTVGDVPEIREAIARNESFLLLGGSDAQEHGIEALPDYVAHRYPQGPVAAPAHIQALVESRYGSYPDAADHRYVRGCSGFTGFARGGASDRAAAAVFSRHATALVGEDVWNRWGSEQVASNFLLANETGTRILPYARYANYWKQAINDDARFMHFVGTHRYSDKEYRRLSAKAVDALR
ncbi:hypothetical protein [Novosphingobium sp. BL-52-GroH]|uniref:hypothetical protein n=1 Tax=Novosphingobium sp. BL-52-GroH TaxID=3349877 RepID=UPI00384DD9B0